MFTWPSNGKEKPPSPESSSPGDHCAPSHLSTCPEEAPDCAILVPVTAPDSILSAEMAPDSILEPVMAPSAILAEITALSARLIGEATVPTPFSIAAETRLCVPQLSLLPSPEVGRVTEPPPFDKESVVPLKFNC